MYVLVLYNTWQQRALNSRTRTYVYEERGKLIFSFILCSPGFFLFLNQTHYSDTSICAIQWNVKKFSRRRPYARVKLIISYYLYFIRFVEINISSRSFSSSYRDRGCNIIPLLWDLLLRYKTYIYIHTPKFF